MTNRISHIRFKTACMTIIMLLLAVSAATAQDTTVVRLPKAQQRRAHLPLPVTTDTTATVMPATAVITADSLADTLGIKGTKNQSTINDTLVVIDSLLHLSGEKIEDIASKVKGTFVPDSKKAMWLAIVFPGGGQIYNHKYWKLPLIYGGFLGCVYALNWNGTMYSDYSQAYIDIMDNDPNTKSYEDFLPFNYDVNANKQRLQDLFRRKKDYYRRYRDLSIFCMIGVYALSIVDAYVDAELSSFDITKDLSMKVQPSVINTNSLAARSPYPSQSYGLRCSLTF